MERGKGVEVLGAYKAMVSSDRRVKSFATSMGLSGPKRAHLRTSWDVMSSISVPHDTIHVSIDDDAKPRYGLFKSNPPGNISLIASGVKAGFSVLLTCPHDSWWVCAVKRP